MKTWQYIYEKYKDTELMKDFYQHMKDLWDCDFPIWEHDIKDIWGYLIVFAETKGYKLLLSYNHCLISELVGSKVFANSYETGESQLKDSEQAILWCTNKFFEIGEKE